METLDSTRRFLRFLARRLPGLFWGAMGLSIVVTLTEGVGLLLLLPLLGAAGIETRTGSVQAFTEAVDRVLAGVGLTPTVTTALLLFFLAMILHEVAARARGAVNAHLYARVAEVLRRDLFRAVARTRWPFFSRQRRTDLAKALTQDVERTVVATWAVHSAAVALSVGVLYLAMATYISVPVTALVAATGALVYLSMVRYLAHSTAIGVRTGQRIDRLYALTGEFLGAMKTIKSYDKVEDSIDRFDTAAASLGDAATEDGSHQAQMEMLYKIGAALGLCVIVYAAVEVFALPTADLLFLLLLFARVMPKLTSTTRESFRFASHVTSFDSIAELIARCEEDGERATAEPGTGAWPSVEIRLRDVRFAYEPGHPVLRGVSLEIPAGQVVALVGASGAGKTTVLDLVMGLLEPTKGVLEVNGRAMTRAVAAQLRRHIGYVGQETFLFHASVRDNLAWAAEEATEEQLRAALAMASADFVHELPRGLDTRIGDRGESLSGGQRQRLSLARALLRDPRLLILDEATSALDHDTEARILDTVRSLRGRMTILIVSHRASAVRDADRVHVLQHGRIVESGPWTRDMMGGADVEAGRAEALGSGE